VIQNINKSGRSGGETAVLLSRKNYRSRDVVSRQSGYTNSPFFWKEIQKVSLKNRFLLYYAPMRPQETIYFPFSEEADIDLAEHQTDA
jgi:hypothetical protein